MRAWDDGASVPRPRPIAAVVIVSLNGENVNGQSTDQTMWSCVMLLCALDGMATQWRPVAHWLSIRAFQVASSDCSYDNHRPVNSVRDIEQCTRETCDRCMISSDLYA